MNNFNIELPLNNLSFGQLGYGILNELFRRGIEPNISLIGKDDLSAFIIKDGFIEWLRHCIKKFYVEFNDEQTSISLWHINGSAKRLTKKSILWTFHETDQLTDAEVNILKNYNKVLVSTKYTKDIFSKKLDNVDICPAFFDDLHFYRTPKNFKNDKVISFCLIGKLEKRKHTVETLMSWAKLYGNNKDYSLNACVFNPFISIEDQSNIINRAFNGKTPWNINFLPHQEKNTSINDIMNASDIHISISGAEGWSLPIFNAMCIGKQAIVLNAHSHTEFANSDNAFLVDHDGMIPLVDGMFFHNNSMFNNGNFYKFSEESFHKALIDAVKVAKERNTEGEKLQKIFSVERTVDKLLSFV